MTTTIQIDTSKSVDELTEEEKDAFMTLVNLAIDYGITDDFTNEEVDLYKAILAERGDRN